MGQPAAKQGDKVMAVDTHILLVPSPARARRRPPRCRTRSRGRSRAG